MILRNRALQKSFLATAVLLTASSLDACECLTPRGGHATFTHQVNLIVWNPETKTEHFVRNASFATDVKDMAFIAPTPTPPEIKKADPLIFDSLEAAMHEAKAFDSKSAGSTKADDSGVDVIQEVDVAGYHAVTLKASETGPLVSWLKKHGYEMTKSASDWSQVYNDKGWYLTAFRVLANHSAAETGAIRLSFKTDEPFNPYFVPKNNQPAKYDRQGLDLYFASTADFEGRIGGKQHWIDPEISFPVDKELRGHLVADLNLPPTALPANLILAYYHDQTFPRVDTEDIFFRPKFRIVPYVEAASIVAIIAGFARLVLRRRKLNAKLTE